MASGRVSGREMFPPGMLYRRMLTEVRDRIDVLLDRAASDPRIAEEIAVLRRRQWAIERSMLTKQPS